MLLSIVLKNSVQSVSNRHREADASGNLCRSVQYKIVEVRTCQMNSNCGALSHKPLQQGVMHGQQHAMHLVTAGVHMCRLMTGRCSAMCMVGGTPEHEVIKRSCHLLRQYRHYNAVGPHNEVSKGLPEEGVQPEAHCLGCVGAAQGLAKVQLELDLRWFPATQSGHLVSGWVVRSPRAAQVFLTLDYLSRHAQHHLLHATVCVHTWVFVDEARLTPYSVLPAQSKPTCFAAGMYWQMSGMHCAAYCS